MGSLAKEKNNLSLFFPPPTLRRPPRNCRSTRRTSKRVICRSSWTRARCLWTSSVNTCPTTPRSGRSPGTDSVWVSVWTSVDAREWEEVWEEMWNWVHNRWLKMNKLPFVRIRFALIFIPNTTFENKKKASVCFSAASVEIPIPPPPYGCV